MVNPPKLSVIAPVYNEEEVISDFLNATTKVLEVHFENYELIIVDDGSKDDTVNRIKEFNSVKIIKLSRNFGKEVALTAGLEHCSGDIIVTIDADLQDPPELIPALVKKLQKENVGICHAIRKSRQEESFLKKITSKLFYKICSKLTGFEIYSNACDFKAINRQVRNSILEIKDRVRYMKMLYAYVGYNSTSVEFERQVRYKGHTKYNYSKLTEAALDAIISNSSKPLNYLSRISLVIAFLSFVFLIKLLFDYLFFNLRDSSTIILILLTFLSSFICLTISIFSEYLSRISVESKNKPLYYIKNQLN